MSPAQLLVHYLIASYAYYILDENVMMDADFDMLSRRLVAVWDTFEHRHKHLVNIESLKESSTAFYIREEDYPPQIRLGFATYVRNLNSGKLVLDLIRIHEIGEAAWREETRIRFDRE